MTAQIDEEDWADLPLFAPEGSTIPHETSSDDTAAMSALSHMIYEKETPEEISELRREQGNRQFKLGKPGYKRAIAEYTAAIDAARGSVVAVPAYLNRANAHARLGNYGYALADGKAALKIDQRNIKALYRCAMSANALRQYEECVKYCDIAIDSDDGALFEKLRASAAAKVKEVRLRDRQKGDEFGRVEHMLKDRGIRIGAPLFGIQTRYSRTVPRWDGNAWLWPVIIVYVGDVERSDYLAEVEEDATMSDLLNTVLRDGLEWDKEGLYRNPDRVTMKFRKDWTVLNSEENAVGSESCEPGEWVNVARNKRLVEVLGMAEYVTPLFPVLYALPQRWRG